MDVQSVSQSVSQHVGPLHSRYLEFGQELVVLLHEFLGFFLVAAHLQQVWLGLG